MTEGRTVSRLACAALLALYAALAWAAAGAKSPTFDEPLHALAAQIALERRDFRIDYDNPPLWKYWAALPNAAAPARMDPNDPHWLALTSDLLQQWPFAMRTLYRDLQNDPVRLISRSRFMMLLLAVALGALISRWAFELGGGVASIAAVFLFAFDPNFLAHGPLVKNDVVVALLLLALAHAVWGSRERMGWRGALAIGLLCGAGCTVKLSGVVLPGVAAALLLARALRRGARARGGLRARAQPLFASVAALVAAAVVTIGCIWAVYGFRFGVSSEPGVSIDTRRIAAEIEHRRSDALPSSFRAGSLPLSARAVVWSLEHRWLPEPWLAGLLFGHAGTSQHQAFLIGRRSDTPWSAYLPLVASFKTPVATLAAFAAAVAVAIAAAASRRRSERSAGEAIGTRAGSDRGSRGYLAIPPLLYAVFALSTPAASGVRHLLPIYPFLFIACGIAAARAWRVSWARWVIGGVGLALVVETVSAFPDYIAFFNAAAGGERGGVKLLSDSNLDWGQDLPLLAAWQREHPEPPLALAYFGTADPEHYGIRYTNLPGGYALGPAPQPPMRPGVIAISATNLQGARFPGGRDPYAPFRKRRPIAVLGGSIYLYALPGDEQK